MAYLLKICSTLGLLKRFLLRLLIDVNRSRLGSLHIAIKDFKFGYLKEKNTIHAIDGLANFITANIFLIDLMEDYDFDFTEIFEYATVDMN